jgi:Uncharacterized conserved protein
MQSSIESYIHQFPKEIQEKLFEIKKEIEHTIPHAEARIAWNMPTYSIGSVNIIHFSVQKSFISLHIGIEAMNFFRNKLKEYSTTKSVIHFRFEDEMPKSFIREVTLWLTDFDH